jgi:hypothetical protein
MKPSLRKFLLWASAIAVALFVFLALGGDEAFQQCVDKYPGQPGEHDYSVLGFYVTARARCTYSLLKDHGEAFVALGTLILAYFTFGLWKETSRLAADARNSATQQIDRMESAIREASRSANAMEATVGKMDEIAERQLRAYVSLETLGPDGTSDAQYPAQIPYRIGFKNCGQTPAYEVSILATVAVGPIPPGSPEPLPPTPAIFTKTTMGPGSPVGASVPVRTFTSAEITAINEGTHQLYVYGVVRYRDSFRKPRFTNFRHIRVADSHKLIACAEGNESD